MKISLPLLAPLMIITCPFSAQVGKEKTVDQKEIKLLVDSLTSVLNHHYIYPEKALMYSKILNANYKSGLYNICETRPKLVNIIHDDLQETNKDMHLRIGYFPNAAKELEIPNQDSLSNTGRDLRLAGAVERNFYFIKKEILPGNIGYLRWDGFDEFVTEALPVFDSAFRYVSHCKAMIIDMRYNGGGSVDMATVLPNYFLSKKIPLNFIITRSNDTIKRFSDPGSTDFKFNQPLYILTSGITASAGEDFSYDLQQSGRATIVGDTTCGAAHTVYHYSLGQGYIIRVPCRRSYNLFSKTNWEGTGIYPNIYSESESALSKVLELLYTNELSNENNAAERKKFENYLSEVKKGKYLGIPFQKQKNTDAFFASEIKDSIVGPVNVGVGFGSVREYHVKTSFLDKGAPIYINEGNSAWFKLTFEYDTLLTFDLVPVDPADDYDFIFFKCPDADCIENIKSNKVKPDRECHSGFPSFNGATGLSQYAAQASVGLGPGPTYASGLPVKAGETYYLMVIYGENYTKEGKVPHGFRLYFHDYWTKKKAKVLHNVMFNSNESVLLKRSSTELDNLAKLLKENKTMFIEIRGHADSEGSEQKNVELSNKRAQSVKDYLISKGIEGRRILCKGFGSSKPITTNNSPEGRTRNRRVEFAVIMK